LSLPRFFVAMLASVSHIPNAANKCPFSITDKQGEIL